MHDRHSALKKKAQPALVSLLFEPPIFGYFFAESMATSFPTRGSRLVASALCAGGLVFFALWVINAPYRLAYVPLRDDVTALADGLLLVPGAHWQDWFTQGHSHFFDPYPEWPNPGTPYARPVFQFLIYLAHFLFGSNWSAYLALNYLGIAGVAAVAFAIARNALGLSVGWALLAGSLTAMAPGVWEYSLWDVGYASEPLATVFVGCAFLAVLAGRDFSAILLLCAALLTKETAVWAPFAAAITALSRPDTEAATSRRLLVSAAMLLPVVLWLALRFAFFGGISGGYASPDYSSLSAFQDLVGWKFAHLNDLLLRWDYLLEPGTWPLIDRIIRLTTALFAFALLVLWIDRYSHEIWTRAKSAFEARTLPRIENAGLVTIWGVAGLLFYFAPQLPAIRYGASAVLFVWPAIVGAALASRSKIILAGIAICSVLSLQRTVHYIAAMNPPSEQSELGRVFKAAALARTTLSEVPPDIRQVYIVSADDHLTADVTPDYLRTLLGMPMEVVSVVGVDWNCAASHDHIVFEHETIDGIVTLKMALPECARFSFAAKLDRRDFAEGRLYRNASINYDLPNARVNEQAGPHMAALDIGGSMTAHIRPAGPARFIIEHADADGGLTWFDVRSENSR